MKKSILVFFASLSFIGVQAQNNPNQIIGQGENKTITTAVPFLNITPDSRAAGMGDVGAATSADVHSAYWNPGKLVFVEKDYGVALNYTPWLRKIINDMSLYYLSGYYKIDRNQAVASSFRYFDLGQIQFRDVAGIDLGNYNPRELSFDVTYSRLLSEYLSIGGSLRYIYSNLVNSGLAGSDTKPGNAFGMDMGVYYRRPSISRNAEWSLAAVISNLGSKLSYTSADNKDFIPTNLRLGVAYKTHSDPDNSFTFAMDINKLMVPSPNADNTQRSKPMMQGVFQSFGDAQGGFKEEMQEIMISGGIEYWYRDLLSARMGYFSEAKNKGNRKYLSFGLGFRYQRMGLDVAYMVPTNKRDNALAETLRLTLMANFGSEKVKKQNSIND